MTTTLEQETQEVLYKKHKPLISNASNGKEFDDAIQKYNKEVESFKNLGNPEIEKLNNAIQKFATRTYKDFEDEHKQVLSAGGIVTGYDELDKDLFFAPTDLNIIQAMSNHGKTTFMLNLLYNFIQNESNQNKDIKCVFITYETSTLRLEEKILNIISKKLGYDILIKYQKDGINKNYLYPSKSYPSHTRVINTYNEMIKSKKLMLLNNIELENLEYLIKLYKRDYSESTLVLFLDYFQIIKHNIKAEGWQCIKEIAYKLESLAVENEIIIFTGSQVNDNRETREGKDIYNSATNVIDIFNHSHDKLKNSDSKRNSKYKQKINNKSIITLTLDKSKHFASKYLEDYFLFDGFDFSINGMAEKKDDTREEEEGEIDFKNMFKD